MIIREHREQFCANTFDKLEEMGKFPEKTVYQTEVGGGSRLRLAALNQIGNAGT